MTKIEYQLKCLEGQHKSRNYNASRNPMRPCREREKRQRERERKREREEREREREKREREGLNARYKCQIEKPDIYMSAINVRHKCKI